MTATTDQTETFKAAAIAAAPEMTRSFFAGAAYMVAVVALGAGAMVVARDVGAVFVPQILESAAPAKFPKYVANDLHRAERWNPDRWDTELTDANGKARNANKVAIADQAWTTETQ